MTHVQVYTDGACSGNPGPGGWGVHFVPSDETDIVREYSGGEPHTTNNRMELMATIIALEKAPDGVELTIFTDSKYVQQGITKWIVNWKANGWKTSARKPVMNQDLWQRLDELHGSTKFKAVIWSWVKGHAKIAGNERADRLAVQALKSFQ
jgi:ribonuclease HI